MAKIHVNVMAPLVVGDPADPDGEVSRQALQEFREHLKAIKAKGVYAVSIDVWWGLVEIAEGVFDWTYYDRVFDEVIAAGLKLKVILSGHHCGGNVGDTVTVNVPKHKWRKWAAKVPNGKIEDVQYVSEQGNASNEFVSAFASHLALDDFRGFFKSFMDHFAARAQHIDELNISLGPAGELRYPSYNTHDTGTGYPTRGGLQCYSRLARESWTAWVLKKYGNEEGVRNAWGQLDKIEPPVNVSAFFAAKLHLNSQYGRDLFDWYQESLLEHGRRLMQVAIDVFAAAESPFKGIDIGAKFPGVHWRTGHWDGDTLVMGDRLAELTCGLIRTSDGDWSDDEKGRGYKPIIRLFKELQSTQSSSRIVVHFTCLEMPDGNDGRTADSLAFQLVRWVGKEGKRQGVVMMGENALADTLPSRDAWFRMRMALGMPSRPGLYAGLTVLRMADIVNSDTAMSELEQTIKILGQCEQSDEGGDGADRSEQANQSREATTSNRLMSASSNEGSATQPSEDAGTTKQRSQEEGTGEQPSLGDSSDGTPTDQPWAA